MNEVGVGLDDAIGTGDTGFSVWLKAKGFDDLGGDEGVGGTCVPHGILRGVYLLWHFALLKIYRRTDAALCDDGLNGL